MISKYCVMWLNGIANKSQTVLGDLDTPENAFGFGWSFPHRSCGSVVEHCISSTKGCGFNFQRTHTDKKCIARLHFKLLWIKSSAKCINVNHGLGRECFV